MAIGSYNIQYPAGIDVFPTWEDDVDVIAASITNTTQNQIVAIETELGTDPAGSVTDVATRLNVSLASDGKLKTSLGGTHVTVDASGLINVDDDFILNSAADTMSANVSGALLTLENTNDSASQNGLLIKSGGTNEHRVAWNNADNTLSAYLDYTRVKDLTDGGTTTLHTHTNIQNTQSQNETVTAGNKEVVVTWGTAFADTTYTVVATPASTDGSLGIEGNVWCVIYNKTTTGCTVRLKTGGVQGAADYLVPTADSVIVNIIAMD